MSQPTGPSSNTMTNQPKRGPMGQREPGGGEKGPAAGEKSTWSNGAT